MKCHNLIFSLYNRKEQTVPRIDRKDTNNLYHIGSLFKNTIPSKV